MRKVLLILHIGLSSHCFSQTRIDSASFLPHKDSILVCLKKFYDEKTNAESYEYNYRQKYKWLKFLPTVGLNLLPLSPLVGISSNQLVNQVNINAQRKAKLLTIARTNSLGFQQDSISLNYDVANLWVKVAYYHFQLTNLELHKSKFSIVEKSYKNNEVTPSEFLDRQIQFNSFLAQIKITEMEIHTSKNGILQKFRYCK